MSRKIVFSVAVLACASAVVGCSSEPTPSRLGVMRGQIIGGSPDTTHQAVMALFGSQSACTATAIAKNGNTGYALTAAHCVEDPPQVLVQGNNYNSGNAIVYDVTDYQADPAYNGDTHDFAMITFSNAGSAPTIPVMTPAEDNLQPGSDVEFVGYGVTEFSNNNTVRYSVDGELAQVESLVIAYEQQGGGPCSGDSGGPSLSLVGGQERVSGVTSYGDQECTEFGVSGRASAVYNNFIAPWIGGNPQPQNCDQCAQGAQQGGSCSGAVQQCGNNQACVELIDCLNACGQNNDPCVQACANQAGQAAVDQYTAIIDCICDSACVQECATECGNPGSSATSGPSSVASSGAGTGAGAGVGGGAGVGVGGGTSSGGEDDGDGDDDGDRNNDDGGNDSGGGCAASGSVQAPGGALTAGLLLFGLALARRRRRG